MLNAALCIWLIFFKLHSVTFSEEAARIKAQGVNIIIALGHSGYQRDQEIALKCPDIDLVIGGHTNTFLYNGNQPDTERIDGPYPTIVKQHSGKEVPVVQAYAYTKYLGKLHVQVKNGSYKNITQSSILKIKTFLNGIA